jgi:hypothetical protein
VSCRWTFACVAAVCALASVPPVAAAGDEALLDAYRPELRYDRSERFFAISVEAWLGSGGARLVRDSGEMIALTPDLLGRRYAGRAGPAQAGDRIVAGRIDARDEPAVYGRSVQRLDGGRWLQYWIFYAFNPQDRGLLRIGRHEGDWELVQLRLDSRGRRANVTLRAHTWAQGCRWSELMRTPSGAPIVFVANGSHANYSRAGVHDRPWPDPNDEADGRGRVLRPRVEPIRSPSGEPTPRWVGWPGRFGNSEASIVPGEQSSPRGPAFQEAWSDPGKLEREARSCTAAPPGRAWQAPVTIGVIALPVLFLLARARRRRRWRLDPVRESVN